MTRSGMSKPTSRPTERAPCRVQIRSGVKALVSTSGSVLLVQEYHSDGTPFWTLPGGGVGPLETPGDALVREVREELHCDCVVGEPLETVWYAHTIRTGTFSRYVVMSCRLCERPEPASSEDVAAVRWVGPDECPPRTIPQVRNLVERRLDE